MKNIIVLSHQVKNYSDWKKNFDSDETHRQQFGIRTIDVLTAVDNENSITAFFETSDMAKFNAFVSSPELKAAMEKGGVISAPEIKVLVSKN